MTLITLAALLPLPMRGDSLQGLWNELTEAMKNDLPKTEIGILERIVRQAKEEKAYGHVLKAQLMKAQAEVLLSSDSLESVVAGLEREYEQATRTDEVLGMVYASVLGKLYADHYSLSKNKPDKAREYFARSLANPELLAAQKAPLWEPLVVAGRDAKIFNNDLLSVMGYEAENYKLLHDYYDKAGNRKGALVTALKLLEGEYKYEHWRVKDFNKSEYVTKLDSLIERYGDLQLAGEVAIKKYELMDDYDVDDDVRYSFINVALKRWGSWPGVNKLRNEQKSMTQPTVRMNFGNSVLRPNVERKLVFHYLRNVSLLKVQVSRLNWNPLEHDRYNLNDKKELNALKKLIVKGSTETYTRQYPGFAPYYEHKDTVVLPGRGVGAYLVEITTDNKKIDPMRAILNVSDLTVICQEQPQQKIRYAVVNATTGQGVANAKLKLIRNKRYKDEGWTKVLDCDEHGEIIYQYEKRDKDIADVVVPFTEEDKYLPTSDISARYFYNGDPNDYTRTDIFTDRRIYRPGQNVHVATVTYHNQKGTDVSVADGRKIVLTLIDSNGQDVEQKELETDEFGVAQTTFTLPQKGLNGTYIIEVQGVGERASEVIRVEEYKRPTFFVEFPEVNQKYFPGDTVVVKGIAKSYAGVPVQGAKVTYTVSRSYAWWWRSDSSSGTELTKGEATTDANGQFDVEMPMTLPESDLASKRSVFYNIIAHATVTDVGGETHEGELRLPLGTRPTLFSCDIPNKSETVKLKPITFTLKNGSGINIDGTVHYTIDGKDMGTAPTNVPVTLALDERQRASGKHHLEAICEGDTIKHDFILFSLDDKHPCVETHDWFYQTAEEFPTDGSPVTIQVGSSDADTHILYSIMAGNKLIESGVIDQSNALCTREFAYRQEYGSGLRLTWAWVKEGVFYTHSTTIAKPLPDKRLMVTWQTFRDRLTPGQKEEWTARMEYPDGTPAKAHLIATLYDKSLDQIVSNGWTSGLTLLQNLPSTSWSRVSFRDYSLSGSADYKELTEYELEFSHWDSRLLVLNSWAIINNRMDGYGAFSNSRIMKERMALGAAAPVMMEESSVRVRGSHPMRAMAKNASADMDSVEEAGKPAKSSDQVRENLDVTAMFAPELVSDEQGNVSIRFTLPESVTTWRFIGMAHDKQMNHGLLEGEAVAKKVIMVQPNMPRFVRVGDEAQIVARLINSSEKKVSGKVRLELIDPETDRIVFSQVKSFDAEANSTVPATFSYIPYEDATLYICRIVASGKGFSDGEQHYLPILPNYEMVTNTYPFTQNNPGTVNVNLKKLFAVTDKSNKLTVEYTNNPAWLMVQALPTVSNTTSENVISQASAFYANKLGSFILSQSEAMKKTIELWGQEKGNETSLLSNLNKNQELKNILIDETPWVMDAKKEADQKAQLINFFDSDVLAQKMESNIEQMRKLQNSDGSWSWWPGMTGSKYMTLQVAEILTRLNVMTGEQKATRQMLDKAMDFLGYEIVKSMKDTKKYDKEHKTDLRPSESDIRYLYVASLDGRQLSGEVKEARDYFLKKMEKQTAAFSIYGKAVAAVIFAKNNLTDKAKLYLESMRQYSVYDEEKGRYYDTSKAGYSWFDYRIPTQVSVIEALQMIEPDDLKTVYELQRWLLQSKRTQAWDTPINSVNAVYAFLNGRTSILNEQEPTVLSVNGKPLDLPNGTAGLGYVKTSVTGSDMRTFTAKKTSQGISWGALYAQFKQRTKNVTTSSAGLTVSRRIVSVNGTKVDQNAQQAIPLKVGDKIRIRITIKADRDYDFVQVLDKRAACMEPVNQLSGYHWGYYCSPKDYSTNYYFDCMSKGEHEVETEYYVDRSGKYETGVCTVQCAYSPEYTARDASITLEVK